MENPHGFIYSHQLDTYKRSKKERLQERNQQRSQDKEERRAGHKRRDRKTKGASTTNVQKTKNKAFNMLLPKRARERNNAHLEKRGRLYKKSKNAGHQLGHYSKNTAQRIDSKKRQKV